MKLFLIKVETLDVVFLQKHVQKVSCAPLKIAMDFFGPSSLCHILTLLV